MSDERGKGTPQGWRQAERAYGQRSGSARWEQLKPFAPAGETTVAEGLHLIQDFGACVALLDPLPHHRILDLGAGSCWASDWLQRLGLSVVATDLSPDLLAVGRERLSLSGAARVACGDAEALPFRTATFDRVLCLNAMHHVPDVPRALREIARVLGAEGRAVFSEPGAGHAQQAHAVRAVQDFGVREADIDAGEFLDQCRAAGFPYVVLEPFSRVIPGYGLTADHWRTWRGLAASSRPRRALQTLRRALLELVGARKDTELFAEAFGSEALRVLRAAMHDHPIVIASKRPINRFLDRGDDRLPSLHATFCVIDTALAAPADANVLFALEVRNSGTTTWIAESTTRGHVRIGVQLLDAEHRLIDRDYARQFLPHDVHRGATLRATVSFQAPSQPGTYFVKIDLVSEGVSWFEPAGSKPAVHRLQVRGPESALLGLPDGVGRD
jgi:SAM-dependent methyltransferase